MELLARIELATSPLPRECSAPELQEQTNNVERVAGIEPAPSAWKAEVLPLNYTRNATRPGILDLLLTSLGNIQITIAGKWWWGKDSNLRSSRNGFTVRPL